MYNKHDKQKVMEMMIILIDKLILSVKIMIESYLTIKYNQ